MGDEHRTRAEEIYERALDADELPDVDELVRSNPELEVPLRRLDERMRILVRVRAARARAEVVGERTRRRDAVVAELRSAGARATLSPRYVPLSPLGRGGMGEVTLAEDRLLRRRVAVKSLRSPGSSSDPGREAARALRLLRECEVLSRLEHPGVVPIHDVGFDDAGLPYFVMGMASGASLAHGLRGPGAIRRTQLLRVLVRLARIVAHAHARGVVHRDIKPANVVVTDDLDPFLVDWGVARILGLQDELDDDPEGMTRGAADPLTLHGEVVGTRGYMAPEQGRGESGESGPPADVYSLGAILLEAVTGRSIHDLTGEDPGSSAPSADAVLAALRGEPPDLVAVCAKALEEDPDRRHTDAGEFAESLELYLDGFVVPERAATRIGRLGRWVAREPSLAAAVLVGLFVTLVGSLVVLALVERTRVQGDEIDRLAVVHRLQRLQRRADACWPLEPSVRDELESVHRDAVALVDELGGPDGLAEQLVQLRARGRPTRRSGPRELPLRRELAHRTRSALEIELAFRESFAPRDGLPDPDDVSQVALIDSEDPIEVEARAWDAVRPERESSGDESWALMAARAVSTALDTSRGLRARARMTEAWALLRLGHVEAAADSARLAVSEAPGDEVGMLERFRESLEATTEVLARSSESRTESLRAQIRQLDELESGARAVSYEFEDADDAWLESQLERAARDLERLADPLTGWIAGDTHAGEWSLERRLDWLDEIERSHSTAAWQSSWASARRATTDPDGPYGGLELEVQLDLWPLGSDPDSGLLEFAHLATGSVPERDATGRLRIDVDSALVLVLIPAGEGWAGAQAEDPGARLFDPDAREREGPVHRIRLPPFLISKYEVTQGQWRRATATEPSPFGPTTYRNPTIVAGPYPVTRVTWHDCARYCAQWGLSLPTEREWEFAARAGTSDPWGRADVTSSVDTVANLADATAAESAIWRDWRCETSLRDGWVVYAPVGTFAPNGFGLHDMVGNVHEWGLEGISARAGHRPRRDGGQGTGSAASTQAPQRGGGYRSPLAEARVSSRQHDTQDASASDLGFRPVRRL